jgi:hypothetical protein
VRSQAHIEALERKGTPQSFRGSQARSQALRLTEPSRSQREYLKPSERSQAHRGLSGLQRALRLLKNPSGTPQAYRQVLRALRLSEGSQANRQALSLKGNPSRTPQASVRSQAHIEALELKGTPQALSEASGTHRGLRAKGDLSGPQ